MDRIDVMRLWQDAAQIERDALVAARRKISELTDSYPRMAELESEIREVVRSIAERDERIERLSQPEAKAPVNSRLASLLRSQEIAREERAALVKARNDILADAEDMGLRDLNEEQDRRFRALTREVAEVDDEIAVRDEEIDKLAALSGIAIDS